MQEKKMAKAAIKEVESGTGGTALAVYDTDALAAASAALGARREERPRMPVLKVNSQEFDSAGREIKKGRFTITGLDGEQVYAKEAHIRPLSNVYQMTHFDSETKKLVGKTIVFSSFRQEAIDTTGGIRLGKPPSKILRDLPKEEQERFKDITMHRIVYAIAELEGETADGKPAKVGPVGVVMKMKGTSFSAFEDEFAKKVPSNRNIYDYSVRVTCERKVNGAVSYFPVHFEADFSSPLPMDQQTYESLLAIGAMIKEENEYVTKKYNEALRGEDSGAPVPGLDADLDDDVPF